jgi:signal transduction histidine kinase/CheY-like chemotaxis protein
MTDNNDELRKLRAEISALRQLLDISEHTTTDQSGRLEKAIDELTNARDEAVEASRIKSQFLANTSHEIRTPISSIIGMIELLLDTALNDDQKMLATVVHDSAQSLLTIINDILDISKMEVGRVSLISTPFSPQSVLKSAVSILEAQARDKGIELRSEFDPRMPSLVVGDPVRLQQILVNLLSNAIKFTDQGRVVAAASLDTQDETSLSLHFEICDTGIGLSDSGQHRLFQPFSQADTSTTRKYGGTGLGLSICKHLVSLMNGQIGVKSEVGQGSTFWFTVPFKKISKERDLQVVSGSHAMPFAKLIAEHPVLVVEDSPTLRELAVRQLGKLGLPAHAVGSGAEALEALSNSVYSAILMDCQMPIMDGYEVTAEIRKNECSTSKHVPIIAMTASAMEGDKERCIDAGMDDYLSKPVSQVSLYQTLKRWIKASIPSS